jgi:hypothetical protein
VRLRLPARGRRAGPPGLPAGLWADDFARLDRACRRFVQVADGRADLAGVRKALQEAPAAWAACLAAAERGARAGVAEVPREDDLAALHRALSRVAGRCAQAAEAVVLGGPDGGAAAAQRAADQALALLRPLAVG